MRVDVVVAVVCPFDGVYLSDLGSENQTLRKTGGWNTAKGVQSPALLGRRGHEAGGLRIQELDPSPSLLQGATIPSRKGEGLELLDSGILAARILFTTWDGRDLDRAGASGSSPRPPALTRPRDVSSRLLLPPRPRCAPPTTH